MVRPAERRDVATYLHKQFEVSISRACKTTGIQKSVFYYESVKDDTMIIEKLQEICELKPTRGFPYFFNRLRNEGYLWNHKRVKRVYNKMRLNLRRKHKRRLPSRKKETLQVPEGLNCSWSMDFMHDTLANGRKVRIS